MPNPTSLSTDEFLRRYTSQVSAPQPVAPTAKAMSADEFAARFTAQSTPPPAPAPETQGGAFSPSSPTDTPLQAGVKTALNLPGSAWNFAKGLVQTMNPVQIAKNIGQIPGEYAALKEEGGGLGSVVKELPGATYEGLVPEAGRALIRGDIEGAQKAVTEDPVGSVAPFVIGARQGAKVIDRVTQGRAQATMRDYVQNIGQNVGKPIPRGTGTNLGGAIDTAIEKTGQLVTKPVGAAASAVGEGVSTGTRFGVSRATGLQPETISQIQKAPEAFTKENMAKADRADLANEVKSRLDERIEAMSDTGAGYENLRRSGAPVLVDRNWLDDVIKETTGLEVKKGKLTTSGNASIRDRQDVNALQTKYDLWKPVFSKGSLTADEFFNFRTDMAGLAKLGREVSKSGPLENLSNIMRGKFNTEYRKQIKGLEETDADFSSMSKELKELRKGILDKNDNLTDQAINRIANATGKGKDQLLARLEEISPGISQKIKVMKAIEDVQNASGIKVGTYDRAALLGSSFVFGGALPGIITAVMTSPNVAVPMLRQYGLLKNAKAVHAVVRALKDSAGAVNALPVALDKEVKMIGGKNKPVGKSEPVPKKEEAPNKEANLASEMKEEPSGLVNSKGKKDIRATMIGLEKAGYDKVQIGLIMNELYKKNNTGRFAPKEIAEVAKIFRPRQKTTLGTDAKSHLAREAAKYKTIEDFTSIKGVDPKNIKSIHQYGSSINNKAKPGDIDLFVTVKEGFDSPKIIDKGRLSFLVANESYAAQMLKDMVKEGSMMKDYQAAPIKVDLAKVWKESQPKTNLGR